MLFTIADSVRSRLTAKHRSKWEREIETRLERREKSVSFKDAVSGGDRFIFEIKRTSPGNRGTVVLLDPAATARLYQDFGAAAVSILTEPDFFGGSLADLAAVRQTVTIPLLRKDFIVDRIQIAEARAFGADAVLLIAALLSDKQLSEFITYASSLSIDALVEVHSESELNRALSAGATIIGVNNRNLQTMTIDLAEGARLLHLVPDSCLRVAESGLKTRADVLMMRESGADAYLIGTALMHASDLTATIRELTGS